MSQKNNSSVLSLFCVYSVQINCPKQEIELSKDELWTLYRAAYEQYKLEILNDGKLYDRYVNDFVSYHLPVFSSEEQIVRNHFKHVSACMSCLQPEKTLSLSTSPSPHLRKETLKQWFMSSTTLKLWLKTLAFLLHSLQNRFDSLRNSPMSRISL